jgi:hypothetical protein
MGRRTGRLLGPIWVAVIAALTPTRVGSAYAVGTAGRDVLVLVGAQQVWTQTNATGRPRAIFSGSCVAPIGGALDPTAPFLAVVGYNACATHYFTWSGLPQLSVMRPNGSGPPVVATDPDTLATYPPIEGPWFAPVGGTLAWVFPVSQQHVGQTSVSAIELIDARTGREKRVITVNSEEPMLSVGPPAQALPIAFSPDGKQLAFVAPGASAISIVDVASGKLRRTIRTPQRGRNWAGVE